MSTREEKKALANLLAALDPNAPDRDITALQAVLDKRIAAERRANDAGAPAPAGPNSWDAFVDLENAQEAFNVYYNEDPTP